MAVRLNLKYSMKNNKSFLLIVPATFILISTFVMVGWGVSLTVVPLDSLSLTVGWSPGREGRHQNQLSQSKYEIILAYIAPR